MPGLGQHGDGEEAAVGVGVVAVAVATFLLADPADPAPSYVAHIAAELAAATAAAVVRMVHSASEVEVGHRMPLVGAQAWAPLGLVESRGRTIDLAGVHWPNLARASACLVAPAQRAVACSFGQHEDNTSLRSSVWDLDRN